MEQINHNHILKSVIGASTQAATFIKKELHQVRSSDIEEKSLNSLVSYVDKGAERIIVDHLQALIPNASFITEEETVSQSDSSSPYRWVIDPLDGTTNFLKAIPQFSVSIALEYNSTPIIGVVYDVMLDDVYSAIRNKGAFLNGSLIQTSGLQSFSEAIIATGFPYVKDASLDNKLSMLKYCLQNSRGIRRMGSAALDLVYVAAGKLDAYYEGHLNRWDLAAGALIAHEAGAVVSDYAGSPLFLDKGEIVASTRAIYGQLLAAIENHLGR